MGKSAFRLLERDSVGPHIAGIAMIPNIFVGNKKRRTNYDRLNRLSVEAVLNANIYDMEQYNI